MKKEYFYLFILSLLFIQTRAQAWDWATVFAGGAGVVTGLKTDHKGNIVSTARGSLRYPGSTAPCYNTSFLAKHDSSGKVLWVQSDAQFHAWPEDIGLDDADNIYITGSAAQTTLCGGLMPDIPINTGSGGSDAFIAKYRTSGDLIWAKHWSYQNVSDPYGMDISTDSAGNSYVAGYGTRPNSVSFLKKFDSNGQQLWNIDLGIGLITDIDLDKTGLYIAGIFHADSLRIGNAVILPNLPQCILCGTGFIGKLDLNGNVLWLKKYGTGHYQINDLSLDHLGQFFVGGTCINGCTLTTCTPSVGGFVAKYNTNGILMGNTGSQPRMRNGTTDEYGNYYCTGIFKGTAVFGSGASTLSLNTTLTYGEMFVTRYDLFGGAKWAFAPVSSTVPYYYWVDPKEITSDNKAHIYLGTGFSGTTAIGSTTLVDNYTRDAYIAKLNTKAVIPITIGIEDEMISKNLNIFPNPSQGFITISSVSQATNFQSITVSDIFGRTLYQVKQVMSENYRIDLSAQPPGIYFVAVKSDEGLLVKKIRKE